MRTAESCWCNLVSSQIVKKINQQHPSEEICVLQFDGHHVAELHAFSCQQESLSKTLYVEIGSVYYFSSNDKKRSNLPQISIAPQKHLAFALTQTYKHIQSTAGIDARAQIIVLCDSSHFEGLCTNLAFVTNSIF